MRNRTILEVMKADTAFALGNLAFDLLSEDIGKATDDKTGEEKKFARLEVEVPKGNGGFSRCRFSVKVPDVAEVQVGNEALDGADFTVTFSDLEISFIDSRGNTYFKASKYLVKEA